MSNKTLQLSDALQNYLLSVSLRESPLLRRLREETADNPEAHMQIAPEQGQLMGLLTQLLGSQRALEVGVYTGYSALCVASALPEDGELIASDVSEEWTQVARRYWKEAGVMGKIDLRLAPAIDTLDGLLAEGSAGRFDQAFIDADKAEYPAYYERCLALLRPGGLIMVDNTLWDGEVVNMDNHSDETEAIRSFNKMLHADERVSLSLVPIGDGLTLARKRG
ncbi:class I SAM-dependent methyltransferase [Myxococcota bacterium]